MRPTARQKNKRIVKNVQEHHGLILKILSVIVLVTFVVNLVTPDKTYSANENRGLAQRPHFSLASFKDGSLFSDYASYYSDQFMLRDLWMSLSFTANYLRGVREFSNVFVGKNHYLLGSPETPDEKALQQTVQAMNSFADIYPDIHTSAMVVPDSASILGDKLPGSAVIRNQLSDIDQISAGLGASISWINVVDALKSHASEEIYYHTDHHWTSAGAYEAFRKAADVMGIDLGNVGYKFYTVSNSFQGTLSSKSGDHRYSDSIHVAEPTGTDVSYIVNYPDLQKRSPSVFVSEQLEEKDQYTVFFGGNHPVVEIQTTANNDRNLLIFKDSYANSFVQFLTPFFSRIVLIDPRYYYDDVSAAINTYSITDILFLYSADTLVKDTALADTLNAAM